MTEQTPLVAWIILALAVAGLLATFVYLAWGFKRPRWPEGRRVQATFKGHTAHLVIGVGVEVSMAGHVATRIARAAWAVASTYDGGKHAKTLATVALMLQTDDEFNKSRWHMGAASYQTYIPAYVCRTSIPLAVVREEHLVLLLREGEPAIHEWLHAMSTAHGVGPDHLHEDERVWSSHGPRSWQEAARRAYQDLVV